MNNRPPNLSALYNFYRYASGGVVPKTAKPVGEKKSVPTAIDWGPNVPMDYLAYLNKHEMALIQQHRAFKGKRSHNGIPAFPDPGDTGYGDRGQGTSSSTGHTSSGGYNSGTAGSKGGGASTAGGGSGGSNSGSGGYKGGQGGQNGGISGGDTRMGGGAGTGPGGQNSGAGTGPGGQNQSPQNGGRGAGGNYGSGSGKPGTSPSQAGGGNHPGESNSPRGFTAPNLDRSMQQKAQVSDAIRTLNNSPSVKSDLSVGGIRTINVGPMGTPVNVGRTIAGGMSFNGPPATGNISKSISKAQGTLGSEWDARVPQANPTASYPATPKAAQGMSFTGFKYDSPITPGTSPEDLARIGAAQSEWEREMRSLNQQGTYTTTGNPALAGGTEPTSSTPSVNPNTGMPYGEKFSDRVPGSVAQAPGDVYKTPTDPGVFGGPISVGKNISGVGNYSEAGVPSTAPSSGVKSISLPDDFRAPPSSNNSNISRSISEEIGGILGPSRAEAGSVPVNESILSGNKYSGYGTFNVPNVPQASPSLPQRENPLAGTGYGTFNMPDSAYTAAAPEDVPEDVSYDSYGIHGLPGEQMLTPGLRTDPLNEAKIRDAVRNYKSGTVGIGNLPTTADATNMTTEQMVRALRQPGVTRGISPSQEGLPDSPYRDPVTQQPAYPEDNFIEKAIKKAGVVGKVYAGLDWASKKHFENMTPSQQAAEQDRWNQIREETRRGTGDSHDRGQEDFPHENKVKNTPKPTDTPTTPKEQNDGTRPQQYYYWDLGVNIPSPTDSEYPLYLKYLQEKAAQNAAR